MDTGIGIAALLHTMMSQSLKNPSGSLLLSLTTILCPCPLTQMLLMRNCLLKKDRSLGWEFEIKITRYFHTPFVIILFSSVLYSGGLKTL